MFGLLKKKISSFIGSLTKKEEEKDEPQEEPNGQEAKDVRAEAATPVEAKKTPQAQPEATVSPSAQPALPKQPESPASYKHAPDPSVQPTPRPPTPKPAETKPVPAAPQKPVAKIEPQNPAIRIPVQPPSAPKPEPVQASQQPSLQPTPAPIPKPAPAPTQPVEKKPEPAKTEPEPQTAAPKKPGLLDTLLGRKPKAVTEKPEVPQAPTVATEFATTPKTKSDDPKPARNEIQTTKPGAQAMAAEPKKERKLEAKLGLASRVRGFFVKEVTIQENELDPMLEELNLALLESDVTLDTADYITQTLKTQLAGKKVEKARLQNEIQSAVKTVLTDLVGQTPLDVTGFVRSHEKPVKILFLGPNGAGKTTTIAKIASHLKSQGLTCVLAAGDTFRAAAIEQLAHHGEKIGVSVIRHQYGSDPSAVAFDAIAHAKARNIDCVLIDTAGRQETNVNLLKEMEKINRVVKPDLKLFIGEAVAGHSLVEQAKKFHEQLKIDGVVLTKVDCDAKGGTSFSVAHEVGVPIVFIGTGQEYGDLRAFDANWLVSSVLAE